MEVRDFMRGGSKVRRFFRGSILRGLTFELRGRRRQGAGPAGENVQRTTGPGLVACRWRSP